MTRRSQPVTTVFPLLVIGTMAVSAANLSESIGQAEGRRRAAENGLRTIRAKSGAQANDRARVYDDAATKQNAWLDSICAAIEKGGTTARGFPLARFRRARSSRLRADIRVPHLAVAV